MRSAFRRESRQHELRSATFCHGQAGLVQVGLRFAAESADVDLRAALPAAVATLIDRFDPASRFGFPPADQRDNGADRPALLDGAAGVALVLLAAGGGVEPCWDRAFLLA